MTWNAPAKRRLFLANQVHVAKVRSRTLSSMLFGFTWPVDNEGIADLREARRVGGELARGRYHPCCWA